MFFIVIFYKKRIFNIFQEDYHLLLQSKPLEGAFVLFRKYRFLNMVTSEIFSGFWKYLGQFFWPKQSDITHFKDILIRKIKKNTKKLQQKILRLFFFTWVVLMWNNSIIRKFQFV
jgi:hypothetical protein